MSDAAITTLSWTAVATKRAAFKPMRALNVRSAAPAAPADEYARGLADGQQMAAAAFEAEREALLTLLANAQALKPDAGPELSELLRTTVIKLVQQICDSVAIDTHFLDARIASAVAIISEADEARQIVLHPDDAALVGKEIHSLPVRSDHGQPRGMVRIDCSQGWIDHGVAIGIERLHEMLEVSA